MEKQPPVVPSEVSAVQIVVGGLRKIQHLVYRTKESSDKNIETFTEQVTLPMNTPLPALWEKLTCT
jgi:hypothetical protein